MPKPKLIEFDAIGTHWWITLHNHLKSTAIEHLLLETVRNFEDSYSRFKDASLISVLNSTKNLSNPPSELVEILSASIEYYKNTFGLFNISIGSLLEKQGYGKVKDDISRPSQNLEKDLLLSESLISISHTTRIDLGGIGKGWLVDKLSRILRENGVSNFIVNGGGDIYVYSDNDQMLALEHPLNSTEYIGTIAISKGALAVSSPLKRSWVRDGKKLSHIQNPDGKGATSYIGAYITADSIVTADVLATVLILASEEQRNYIAQLYKIEYMLIREDLSFITSSAFKGVLN
jgi:thiamine biosynthesis lipoprotein